MNWKILLLLSFFGLAMGLATISQIQTEIEPFFWLGIFIVSAYFIASKTKGRYFLHGILLGLLNSVWVTSAHVIFFDAYIAHHAAEATMLNQMTIASSAKMSMAVMGPLIGLGSGLVLGIFATVASNIVQNAE